MLIALQFRDEGFLARDVTFSVFDMSPGHREPVFCRYVDHRHAIPNASARFIHTQGRKDRNTARPCPGAALGASPMTLHVHADIPLSPLLGFRWT
jgi:hypothetical protein